MSKVYEILIDNAFGELIEIKQRTENSIAEVVEGFSVKYASSSFHVGSELVIVLYTPIENDTRTFILCGKNLIDAAFLAAKFWGKLKGLH